MTAAQAIIYRLITELATLIGVICAAVLALYDKSPWVWSWFLIYAVVNLTSSQDVR